MSDSRTFRGWLQQQRQARGVTQDDLAEDLGFSAALLRKLEAGERRASVQIVDLLAALFPHPGGRAGGVRRLCPLRPGCRGRGRCRRRTPRPRARPGAAPTCARPIYRLCSRPSSDGSVRAPSRTTCCASPKTRLLTLTGPPGIGKTRLGCTSRPGCWTHFPDGVFFVDLAPLSDPALVVPTIARTLGLQRGGRPAARAGAARLRGGRRMLLLLDNFEQVLDAGARRSVQLLQASPWLKVLVTSREALHVRGERRFPVPPLGAARPGRPPCWPSWPQYPAVALFVERAQAVRPRVCPDRGERAGGGGGLRRPGRAAAGD